MPLPAVVLPQIPWKAFVKTIVSTLPFGEQLFAAAQIWDDFHNSRFWQLVTAGSVLVPGRSLAPRASFFVNPCRAFSSIIWTIVVFLSIITFITVNMGIAFHPICQAALFTNSQFCRVVATARQMTMLSDAQSFFPPLFDNGTQILGDIVENNAIVSTTSVDLTKAHIVIDDLLFLVQHSTLSRKELFSSSLDFLRGEARETGFRLQSFAALLDGSVHR